eukprot:30294-Pelagococcus_subviridis.AAC.60
MAWQLIESAFSVSANALCRSGSTAPDKAAGSRDAADAIPIPSVNPVRLYSTSRNTFTTFAPCFSHVSSAVRSRLATTPSFFPSDTYTTATRPPVRRVTELEDVAMVLTKPRALAASAFMSPRATSRRPVSSRRGRDCKTQPAKRPAVADRRIADRSLGGRGKNASGVRGSLPSGSSARLERIAGCDSLFAAARDVNTRLPCVRDAGSARIRSGAALFQEPRGQHV